MTIEAIALEQIAPERPCILLLGSAGQIGRELATTLQAVGSVIAITRNECNLADPAAVNALLLRHSPQIIVNAAAYTAVDRAESEPELAAQLNIRLPEQLAAWAAENDALLVDYSTDYVFDGNKTGLWSENDKPAPLNVYGQTKLEGLRAIEKSGCDYLVFRVTWIYARQGSNFPNTILRLAAEREEISVVCDQHGSPTPADWIAEVTADCIAQVLANRGKCGLYNLAPAGSASWHEFACDIVKMAESRGKALKLRPERIKAIPTSAYPTPAKRPANSVLDTARLRTAFAILPPHWRSLFLREGSIGL